MKSLAYLLIVSIIFSLLNCNFIESFFEKPKIDPCDPSVNLYMYDKHFIDREYVKENGMIDYEKWFKDRKNNFSPCDPVKGSP